jgi:hypothetical protein
MGARGGPHGGPHEGYPWKGTDRRDKAVRLNARVVWQAVLTDLQLHLPRSDFETWLQGTSIAAFEDGLVVVSTPNSFAKQWLERKAGSMIRKALSSVLGYAVQLRVTVGTGGKESAGEQGSHRRQQPAVAVSARAAPASKSGRDSVEAGIAPRDRRKIGAFLVQDCILDDYAPVLRPLGLAVLTFFYMMAHADTRECWFSQRHLAQHLGVHRSHYIAPVLVLLQKLRLVKDTGRRTRSGAYYWLLLNPLPIVRALLHLLAVEDRELRDVGKPCRTVAEKIERVRGLYPVGWRPVRKKAQYQSVPEVLAAVEKALRGAEGQALPAGPTPPEASAGEGEQERFEDQAEAA